MLARLNHAVWDARTQFFFSSRRRHTRYIGDWSSDVCSSDLRLPDVSATAGHAGIVEEQVHGPELRGRTISELLHVLCPRHVGVNPQRLYSACADLADHRVERVILHVRQHQVHPLARRDARELTSESAARARDDGDLA